MIESGYYPPGAEFDTSAPWNQHDSDPIDLDVCISQTLHKTTTIEVDDYVASKWEEYEDGVHTGGIDYDTSDCDLYRAVSEQISTPVDIINALPDLFKSLCEELKALNIDIQKLKSIHRFSSIASSCQGWEEDELEVVKE